MVVFPLRSLISGRHDIAEHIQMYTCSVKQSYTCISSVTTWSFCSSIVPAGSMRVGFSRYIGPESQEEDCESLKNPITLAIDDLFLGGYFQLFLVYLKK